jgi:hypothetical protein
VGRGLRGGAGAALHARTLECLGLRLQHALIDPKRIKPALNA